MQALPAILRSSSRAKALLVSIVGISGLSVGDAAAGGMAAAAVGSDDPFLTPGYAWWYSKDDLLAWGFDNDEESFRIVRKVEEVREAQGLFARGFRPSKATRFGTKKPVKTWYFRMPRRDGQLVALQPAFGPKDQLQLVDQLEQ